MNVVEKDNQEGLIQNNKTSDSDQTQTGEPLSQGSNTNEQIEGLFKLIAKDSQEVESQFGKPERIDVSAYGYDWWIYNTNPNKYVQIGIENEKVVTVFAIGKNVEINPFRIGQPIGEIYTNHVIDTNINLKYKKSSYRFELSEEDYNTHPLIKVGNVYAQLYIDKFTGTLSSIRLMDAPTFIKVRPYELVYRGNLLETPKVEQIEVEKLDRDNEKQIFDLTNILRSRFDTKPLEWEENTAKVAYAHSVDMYESNEFSHSSKKYGELSDRLKAGEVVYKSASENIAANYIDAPDVIEGWLNSKGHRDSMLNKDFTHLGVGVYKQYYTQNFIQLLEQ